MNNQNTKRRSLFGMMLLLTINSYGQNKDSVYIPRQGIKLSYLGAISYPGLRLGTEFPMRIKYVVNHQRHRTKVKSQFLTFNLAYYHQKAFHDNLYLTSEANAKSEFKEM